MGWLGALGLKVVGQLLTVGFEITNLEHEYSSWSDDDLIDHYNAMIQKLNNSNSLADRSEYSKHTTAIKSVLEKRGYRRI